MSAKWYFPSTGGGRKAGLNDSGIETFKDKPIRSLAREICQNSLDAAIKGKKAIVEFNTFTINSEDFPDVEGFRDVLARCKDYASLERNEKAESFFDSALEKIGGSHITMLRISDFNTTGLTGLNWDGLIDKAGSSNKENEKLGSFGIGKNAPFACSDFRTIFYSTLTETEQKSKGVSILTTFKIGEYPDGSDNLSQAIGFWGDVGQNNIAPVFQMVNLDKNFHRESTGTDIYVSAFNMQSKDDFKRKIISEVLDSFLLAIWNEKLAVNVDGTEINKDTLQKVVEEFKDSLNTNTVFGLELLSDPQLEWHKLPIKMGKSLPLGNIKFGFKIKMDGTNKIAMIRSSGMKILDRTNLCKTLRYVGIGIIEGELLNKFLRDLESPLHDKWEADRYGNPAQARAILKDINNAMSDKLNEIAASLFDEQIDIEGAGEYLPDEVENEGKNPITAPQTDFDKIIAVETKVIKKARSVAHLETDEIGEDLSSLSQAEGAAADGEGFEGLHYQGRKSHGQGEKESEEVGFGDGRDELKSFTTVKSKNIRVICLNKREGLYRITFIPAESSTKAYIEVIKLAEQNEKTPMQIVSVLKQDVTIKNNKIGYFTLQKDVVNTIDFKIAETDYSAMEVKIYAYQG